ncbi:26135_t:CDS:1, partial [Dentiscutata erythropus]
WEDLKDNLKCMISSILDKPRKSIVMDRIVKEILDNNTIIITEDSEIKELVKEHFHNWTRKRTTDAELFKKWESEYTPLKEINNLWYDTLYNEVKLDELEVVIQFLPNNKVPGQFNL